jgi:hypothetical protein
VIALAAELPPASALDPLIPRPHGVAHRRASSSDARGGRNGGSGARGRWVGVDLGGATIPRRYSSLCLSSLAGGSSEEDQGARGSPVARLPGQGGGDPTRHPDGLPLFSGAGGSPSGA